MVEVSAATRDLSLANPLLLWFTFMICHDGKNVSVANDDNIEYNVSLAKFWWELIFLA